jgi:ribosome-binding factor A
MSIRTDRVGRMIQREVADLLQQDFGEATQSLVTVTGVRMTDDLGLAYIDVSVLGTTSEQRQAAFARLEGQTTPIRHALAQRIRHQVRRIPELKFFLDEGPQRVERMEELFAKIAADREDEPRDEGDTDEAPSRGDY